VLASPMPCPPTALATNLSWKRLDIFRTVDGKNYRDVYDENGSLLPLIRIETYPPGSREAPRIIVQQDPEIETTVESTRDFITWTPLALRLSHKSSVARDSSFFGFGNSVEFHDFNHVGKAGVAFP